MLRKVGIKNIHPRVYKTSPANRLFLSIERTQDEHIWIQVGRIVFTSQPRGDGLWDKFWDSYDNSWFSKKLKNIRKRDKNDYKINSL